MITAEHCNKIFFNCIDRYHILNDVDQQIVNPYEAAETDPLLYEKCWIDTVQWHYEDLIRDPNIEPVKGMALKKLIDASNQRRTDMVEQIDDLFLHQFRNVLVEEGAKVNSESPAWVIDRLSILALKIYHMQEQSTRQGVSEGHHDNSIERLKILHEQQQDLSTSFNELISDLQSGKRKMKVYRQMKLYNDPATNPVLYKSK